MSAVNNYSNNNLSNEQKIVVPNNEEVKTPVFTAVNTATSPLFEEPAKGDAVLLIDSSGSTSLAFAPGNTLTVFDKILSVASQLDHENFRLIFWNSPNFNSGKFSNGTVVLPFILKKNLFQMVFASVSKDAVGGTNPSIGFKAIPVEWLKNDPVVYLITDGQFAGGHEERELAQEINRINARICIIAVENTERDFNNLSEVAGAAGGDIYRIIQQQHLTAKVSQFISYSRRKTSNEQKLLNNHTESKISNNTDDTTDQMIKFTHINKCKPPAGYIPYGNKYFSELRVNEFAQFISSELKQDPSETKQLEIAQRLSTSLEYLTKDKPRTRADDIIKYFSSLFTVDADMIRWILADAIEKERSGQAGVFANYRADLKNLFQQADALIKRDVCDAIGLGSVSDMFVSYTIEDHVLTGSYRLVDKSLTIHGNRYPRCAYEHVPVFPMMSETTRLTDLQEQCLRQWTRCVYSAYYRVHPTSDEIIFLVLGNMLKVCSSPEVSDQCKASYRRLARVILNKKRLNSMQTEYDRIANGDVPIPNSGNLADFETYMSNVSAKLCLSGSIYRLWYDMCYALDPIIVAKQEKHCTAAMSSTAGCQLITEDKLPTGMLYDYTCIITTEDISAVGGFRILPHQSAVGTCEPVYLLSSEGKNGLLRSHNCVCPVCYTPLNNGSFEKVGAKRAFDLPVYYQAYKSRFNEQQVSGYMPYSNQTSKKSGRDKKIYDVPRRNLMGRRAEHMLASVAQSVVNNNTTTANSSSTTTLTTTNSNSITQNTRLGLCNANGCTGTLVILKGVVGCGKSTTAQKIYENVLARGGVCYVEGTDKYCKTGVMTRDAVTMVNQQLFKIEEEKNNDMVVVIDTCGEQTGHSVRSIFGLDFSGWKRVDVWPNYYNYDLAGYFAWSLRNVLMRRKPRDNDNHYLNPETAGVHTCIDVHRKKARALFPNNYAVWQFSGATIENLEAQANEYAKLVTEFVMPNDV